MNDLFQWPFNNKLALNFYLIKQLKLKSVAVKQLQPKSQPQPQPQLQRPKQEDNSGSKLQQFILYGGQEREREREKKSLFYVTLA